ncbi:MAG: hypothetical protein QGF53_04115, partial [Alphaproteobacteria bacterium]|nr:hypothetical protein [Alphaproteobacteria bacterium]
EAKASQIGPEKRYGDRRSHRSVENAVYGSHEEDTRSPSKVSLGVIREMSVKMSSSSSPKAEVPCRMQQANTKIATGFVDIANAPCCEAGGGYTNLSASADSDDESFEKTG